MNRKERHGQSLVDVFNEKTCKVRKKNKSHSKSNESLSVKSSKQLQEEKVPKTCHGEVSITKNNELIYYEREKTDLDFQEDQKKISTLEKEVNNLKSSYSVLEFQYFKLKDEKIKQADRDRNHWKTVQIVKNKIKSLLDPSFCPSTYPDTSFETISLASVPIQAGLKTRSLDLDKGFKFCKGYQNTQPFINKKDFECQVSLNCEILERIESPDQTSHETLDSNLNKYLKPEESSQFLLIQIEAKNSELLKLNQDLQDLEEKYKNDLFKVQSENQSLVVFANDLQDQLEDLRMIHGKYKEKTEEFQQNIEKYQNNLQKVHEKNINLKKIVKKLKNEAEIKEKLRETKAEDLAEAIFNRIGNYEDLQHFQTSLCKVWNANFEVLEVRISQDLLKRIFGEGFEEFFLISQNRIKSLQAEVRNYELLLLEKKTKKKKKNSFLGQRNQKKGKRVSFAESHYENYIDLNEDSNLQTSEVSSSDLLNFLQCSASLLEELCWNL